MPKEKRKQIMDICLEQNITYVGTVRNPRVFQMQECKPNIENSQTASAEK